MDLHESLWMAIESIRTNKARAILTTIGIVFGVLAIIAMQTLVQGFNTKVGKELSIIGSSTFYVQKYPAIRTGHMQKYRNRKNITMKEVNAIEARATLLKLVSPDDDQFGITVKYRDRHTNPMVMAKGGNEFWALVSGYMLKEGRFITHDDVRGNRNVVILGMDVVDKLFPFEDPLGKSVLMNGHKMRVIGVFEEKGKIFGFSQDNVIFMPITTFFRYFGTRRSISIAMQADRPQLIPAAIDQVTGILRAVRKVPPGKPNDFEIVTRESLLDTWNKISSYISIVATAIAAMSLLVGGIGIMNIMLVTVTERTREIGIRKAIGAKRKDILWQFIVEAVILSEIGGIIGVILGVGGGKILGIALRMPSAVPIWAVLLAIGFSSLIGLFFGIYPASKAAKLNPIEALRYE
ncbi:macrolide export ATP-binding/permease protein MacB [bacterium BMS3Abin05]|nr:macrolide export ATP-binding/permease protein MacB [bacterium BMS3Abin05]GBE26295.1 macrolide export ATP-binding/permease protein MacB [bacterium BMS3Bbin03]HDK35922.1 FtsX-like permease family protein [Bacteroidota bacterium]HDL78966.1 FtsX-like permease family protein [Bacteroidota bacterium]HDZ11820.1 FtsX-like permease family protein [Bacteroidota bacterium]